MSARQEVLSSSEWRESGWLVVCSERLRDFVHTGINTAVKPCAAEPEVCGVNVVSSVVK